MYKVTLCRTGIKKGCYGYNRHGLGSFVKEFRSLSHLAGYMTNVNAKRWNLCIVDINPPLTKEARKIYSHKMDALYPKEKRLKQL